MPFRRMLSDRLENIDNASYVLAIISFALLGMDSDAFCNVHRIVFEMKGTLRNSPPASIVTLAASQLQNGVGT